MSTYATDIFNGDGSTDEFDLTFPFISRDHVGVTRIEKADGAETVLTVIETGTPVGDEYRWENDTRIKVGTAPSADQQIAIRRDTPENQQLVPWADGSYLISEDLNTSDLQWLYGLQELEDKFGLLQSNAIKYLGAIDLTVDAAPASPEGGDFYINSGLGTVVASWAGIAGDAVVGAEQIIYNQPLLKWEIFETPASQIGVVEVQSAAPIAVDSTDSQRPVVSIADATASVKGSMSAADKAKLDGIAPGATVGIPDAPSDGDQYARKDAAWSAIDIPPETIVSPTPPSNPIESQLWFDSTDGRTYVYYTDADSSQWVESNPSWNGSIADGSVTPPKLDRTYVETAGDNMTGDLTLGTNKITLNAGSGSATFAGQVNTGGEWDAPEKIFSARLSGDNAFKFRSDRTSGSIVDFHQSGAAATDIVASIMHDGSATFAGTVNPSSVLVGPGALGIDRGLDDANSAAFYVENSTGVVTRLNCDGSATFDGTLTTKNFFYNTNSSGGLGVAVYNSSGSSSNKTAIAVADNASGSPKSIELKYDGSASFSRNITSTRYVNAISGISTNVNGTDYGYALTDASSNLLAGITITGSASFAGVVTGKGVTLKPSNGSGGLFVLKTDGTTTAATVLADGTANFASQISVNGINGRQGGGGTLSANFYNFYWTGTSMQMWVDMVNLGDVNYSSDYRIKREIQTIDTDATSRVKALRPVSYKRADYGEVFKASEDTIEGFIAHEVQEVIPSGATGSKDCEHEIQSLRLDAILAVTVKALQESLTRIEALEAKVTSLQGGTNS